MMLSDYACTLPQNKNPKRKIKYCCYNTEHNENEFKCAILHCVKPLR